MRDGGEHYHSIQLMRGLAAVAVLLFHANERLFDLGSAGVDLFFVISGFIMARLAPRRQRREFLIARLWRVLPLYYVTALLYYVFADLPKSQCRDLASISLWPYWGEYCQPYLHQAWTLLYELIFYGLIAAFIRDIRMMFVIIPIIVGAGWLIDHPVAEIAANPLLLEFLLGMALSYIHIGRGGLLLLPIAIVWFVVAPEVDANDFTRVLSWGIPSAMIFAAGLAIDDKVKSSPLTLIGDASYSIYLIHLLVMWSVTLQYYWEAALGIVAGLILYFVVERPFIAMKGWWRQSDLPSTQRW